MASNDDNITSDLNSRLDELFGDDDVGDVLFDDREKPQEKSPAPVKAKTQPEASKNKAKPETPHTNQIASQASQLSDLQSVLLSFDWEITDEVINNFINELNKLKEKFRNDKIYMSFIQIHETLGKYIKSKKVNAHPDSMKLVHSVFQGFEKVLISPGMIESEKKKILTVEFKKLKELKQKISGQTKPVSVKGDIVDLDAIKNLIRAEFVKLKDELIKEMKAWR